MAKETSEDQLFTDRTPPVTPSKRQKQPAEFPEQLKKLFPGQRDAKEGLDKWLWDEYQVTSKWASGCRSVANYVCCNRDEGCQFAIRLTRHTVGKKKGLCSFRYDSKTAVLHHDSAVCFPAEHKSRCGPSYHRIAASTIMVEELKKPVSQQMPDTELRKKLGENSLACSEPLFYWAKRVARSSLNSEFHRNTAKLNDWAMQMKELNPGTDCAVECEEIQGLKDRKSVV